MVNQNGILSKTLVVGVIILFVGVGIQPAIAEEPITTSLNIPEETVTVNINYIKPSGVENVNKKIPFKTLTYILELMDNEDFETLSYMLKNLGLSPKSMNIKQIEELINGELARKEYTNILKRFNSNNYLGDETTLKNIFCKVEGDAVDHFFNTPFTYAVDYGITLITVPIILCLFILDLFLRVFPWYQYEFPYYISPLQALMWYITDIADSLIDLLNPYKKPERIVPVALPILGDWYPVHQNPKLTTSGFFGEWKMQEYQVIDFTMVGFTGIWISYSDGYQYEACNFSGYSLFVKANGINPE